MTLDILICTYNEGIYKVKDILLPITTDIFYKISHQITDDKYLMLPVELMREDIVVNQVRGAGLAKNRNNAILIATSDICLIADDDVRYTLNYLNNVIFAFEKSNIDVGLFKIKTLDGEPGYKSYPYDEKIIKSKKYISNVSSIEIAFKLDSIVSSNIRFDERFGLGTDFYQSGEENIFINECLKKNKIIKFIPKYVVIHPFESSRIKCEMYSTKQNMTAGAVSCMIYGYMAFFRNILSFIKNFKKIKKHNKSPFLFLKERTIGTINVIRS